MISLIVTIAIVGLCVYLVQAFIPMPAEFKKAITVVAIVGLVIYVLQAFGLFHGFRDIRINR